MNVDPTRNMVVFLLRRGEGEHAIADAPTRDEDGVRQAWQVVAARDGARPEEVVALHTEWATTDTDARFIGEFFPQAQVTHNFDRPEPGDWDRAFAEVRDIMRQAHEEQLAAETSDRMRHAEENGELLPVLWSAASPRSGMLQSLPHQTLVPGRLHVALAMVAPTPRGTLGMSHLTHDTRQRIGEPPVADLFDEAYGALSRGLRIDGRESEKGQLLTLHREGSLAASAVALPGFGERMMEVLDTDRLVVGIPCPDDLVVAAADSGWAPEIQEMVRSSPYPTTELVPSVLLIDRAGIQLVGERE
ncbi:hypothetical protein [Plantactinospora sp. B24E8]|uniref:hypothetical protein n=1 Tax=Plantactinospora sp. B24E8 TaxID=3153567 RepID=UPI00325E3EAE